MNGVIRGGHFSTGKALNVRSSGLRDAYSLRGNGSTQIGFRLDGVRRGGYYSATYGHARDVRSAYRDGRYRSSVNAGIGFRFVNGVVLRGGEASLTISSVVAWRCGGYRSGDYNRNVVRNWLGFLCEGCM